MKIFKIENYNCSNKRNKKMNLKRLISRILEFVNFLLNISIIRNLMGKVDEGKRDIEDCVECSMQLFV
jgi:hypothetical protein